MEHSPSPIKKEIPRPSMIQETSKPHKQKSLQAMNMNRCRLREHHTIPKIMIRSHLQRKVRISNNELGQILLTRSTPNITIEGNLCRLRRIQGMKTLLHNKRKRRARKFG